MTVLPRLVIVCLLLAGTIACSGCLGTVIQAVTSPQTLIGDAAGQVANATTSTVAEALGPPQSYEQTVTDLDRIIADHSEEGNAANLRALRDRLSNERGSAIRPHRAAWPPPPDEFDRRLGSEVAPAERTIYTSGGGLVSSLAAGKRGPLLVVEPPIDPGDVVDGPRQPTVPYMPPRTSSLPDGTAHSYVLDSRPVRLADAPANRHE